MIRAKRQEKPNAEGRMSLSGHLKELRNRAAVVLAVLLLGFVACLSFASRLVTLFTDMGEGSGYVFVYIAPQELLMVYMNLALIGAIVLAFPVLVYEIYSFCSPALEGKQRRFVILALTIGTAFFVLGIFFAYYISIPFMLGFLIQFTGEVNVSASISIQAYISFLTTVFLIFGIVFEMPVISVSLTGLGLLRPEWLVKGRKVMIVLIFVVAAVITPPDVVSQVMVALPMIALYELSIVLCRLFARKRVAADSEDGE